MRTLWHTTLGKIVCFCTREHQRVPSARLVVLALLLLAVQGPLAAASPAADKPTIRVGATIVAEPGIETPLSIQVTPAEAIPRNSFIRLRGLPPTATLTEGHAISGGTWAVPLIGLTNLRVLVPAGYIGRAEVAVSLVTVDGPTLAETHTALVVASASAMTPALARPRPDAPPIPPANAAPVEVPRPVPAARSERPPIAPSAKEMAPGEREKALSLKARGDKLLAEGNVAAARLFYPKAADNGLAEAALALGATYDPAELARLGVQGMLSDPVQARHWYERAVELGAVDGSERLSRLGR